MGRNLTTWERWWLSAWPHRVYVRWYMRKLLSSCPDPVRGEVLEAGAGYGWTARRILERYPQVELTATDIDSSATRAFDRLRQSYGKRLKVQEADICNLPFDRASFDMVISAYVLPRVDDPREAVRQILRVTRPGGLIGIVGGRHLECGETAELFKEEGCEIEVARGNAPFWLWARKPYPVNIEQLS